MVLSECDNLYFIYLHLRLNFLEKKKKKCKVFPDLVSTNLEFYYVCTEV